MNQKNGRTDPGPLRERARSLFISQATIDETLEWATPRQLDAIDRMLATELANREACVCSIESGPCERVDVFHVSGRFWSTSACGEKRTPARPAWTSFPS